MSYYYYPLIHVRNDRHVDNEQFGDDQFSQQNLSNSPKL